MNKSGVISFFQELFYKKVELHDSSGNYSKKKWSYVIFPGITGDTWLFRENVEKNEVLAIFDVLIQESENTFGISVTIA